MNKKEQAAMKKRTCYILAVCAAVLLLSVAFVLKPAWFKPKPLWYCSPTTPRPSGVTEWKETISTSKAPDALDEHFFDSFVTTSDTNGFTVEYPIRPIRKNPFAFELAELKPHETLSIGGGTLELSAIGTAYLDANQTLDDEAEYRFYDPRFQSIPYVKVAELGNDNFVEHGRSFQHTRFPFVQFVFRFQDTNDIMFHGIRVFDARTHKPLGGGRGRTESENNSWFRTNVLLWHRAPVDVVFDVSYGPTKTFDFAPRAGEGFRYNGFRCRLIDVFEGVDPSISFSSGTRRNMLATQIVRAAPDRAGLRFLFACLPQADHMPATFDFLDQDGQILSGLLISTSVSIQQHSMQQPLEEIAIIRAHYRTKRHRIVMRLPYIPGLPEQNKKIDNLFDVFIPYVRLSSADQVGHFLMHTLQVRAGNSTGRVPTASINNAPFPMDFKNVTVRDIARRYAEGGKLHTDPNSEQLTREYPIPLRIRIERFLDKIFGYSMP